jgi:hypothetical protein
VTHDPAHRLSIAVGILLLAGAAGAGFFLLNEQLIGAFHGLANKLLTFNVAVIGVFAMEMLYDWRHHIDNKAAFDRIEQSGADLSRYYGFRIVGLCILAAAIFGSI